jgi:hypothetical protein
VYAVYDRIFDGIPAKIPYSHRMCMVMGCIYGFFGRGINECTVIYGVCI